VLGTFGWNWLLKNFITISVEERKDVQLDFSRYNVTDSANDEDHRLDNYNLAQFVSEEELDKYRYIHPYMFQRKLTDEIIELFDIGYDKETECITFPVKDEFGNCLFVARRSVKGKYFNYPKDVEKPLYGLYELISVLHPFVPGTQIITKELLVMTLQNGLHNYMSKLPYELIICESMLDALTCWVYGKYAIALNGLGSAHQVDLLNRLECRKYILATDKDEKGKEARKKLRKKIKGKLITEYDYNSYPEHAKDINDMSKEEFQNLVEIF
jgi:DNA primase